MNIMAEIAIICGVCLVSEVISALIPAAFPASVIALVLLALLLFAKILKPEHIQRFSAFLVANMAFFFLPSCAIKSTSWSPNFPMLTVYPLRINSR